MPFLVYILELADGSYCTGHVETPPSRGRLQDGEFEPQQGSSARPAAELAFCAAFATREEAVAAERRIKGWRRDRKRALVERRIDLSMALARVRREPAPTATVADDHWMRHALQLAMQADVRDGEVPVGAVIIDDQGRRVAAGTNRVIADNDPTAHAEIVALRAAGQHARNYRLPGTTLYVTLEPCAMCAMALVHARVGRVVYAARDPRTGAAGSVFDLLDSSAHNHRIEVDGGVLADEAGRMLGDYFRRKRGKPGPQAGT